MKSNEREAKLKATSRHLATQGQIDGAYQPIRACALLNLCYNIKVMKFRSVPTFSLSQKWVRFGMCGM